MVEKSQKHCTYIQYDVSCLMSESKNDDTVYDKLVKYILICQTYSEDFDWLMNCKNYSKDCDWIYQFTWIYTPLTLDFLCSIDFCILYKNRMQKIKHVMKKWLIKLK